MTTDNTHGSLSPIFLQMNVIMSELSRFLFIYSREGSVAHAISFATFFILWSGSNAKNTYSVTITNIPMEPLLLSAC